ncbi:cell division protein FtsZ [Thermophagus xiamenensis]|uniref:Cell division protein FtsZ n=1 Tax=Thermophagus xiamenensis TaxID=385682 RepID=A0A1I1YL92_9BACT|nr:cell division protein FtsZ [Thermophagus xiamenensis]SFE19808.1 cell division protein FtsZ [Thermophagus xiamenensis]
MIDDLMNFDIPDNPESIIKVVGVGGGGSNAVNYMYGLGIKDVTFVVCNTDAQALANSPVPLKIQLGASLTEGRGAGNKPLKGREAAIESLESVNKVLEDNTKMVFITAGMGGGTGTGAAPEIAKAAKEMGILTVGIVTIPFKFEGWVRIEQALNGIAEMEKHVDSLLIINNEKLREMYGDLKLSNAFSRADNVLATAAKGIAEIITVHGYINVDFADVETVMKNSGVALMGSASAGGEDRAIDAIQAALESPLLNNNDIRGAKNILLNITSGTDEITMDEVGIITDYLQDRVGDSASIIWGSGTDERLNDEVGVTIIATGFASSHIINKQPKVAQKKVTRFTMDENGNVSDEPEQAVAEEPSEDENARVFNFDDIDNDKERQIEQLYGENTNSSNKVDATDSDDLFSWALDTNKNNVEPLFQYGSAAALTPEELNDEKLIDEMENIPAYKRRNVSIDDNSARQKGKGSKNPDRKVSRFTLSGGKGNPRISDNNPYLHDNVD